MATQRTYTDPISGTVVHFNENRTYMSPFGNVVSEQKITVPTGNKPRQLPLMGVG